MQDKKSAPYYSRILGGVVIPAHKNCFKYFFIILMLWIRKARDSRIIRICFDFRVNLSYSKQPILLKVKVWWEMKMIKNKIIY